MDRTRWDVLMHLHYASKGADSDTIVNVVFSSNDGSKTVKIKAVTDVCTLQGINVIRCFICYLGRISVLISFEVELGIP